MRLGIISDTHGRLPNAVFEIFSQVDHILHGGDVGKADV
ncbi:MAG: metallophosphoesterase family protein, partial [Gemmatimonadetes bacterium]|nr:metallophosphoesterase family protein [Gemmatimonadota bacterium]